MKSFIAQQLHAIDAISYGDFTLKSGLYSPVYVDMRKIISYPDTFKKIIDEVTKLTKSIEHTIICGVPYAALSVATGVALQNNKPMIMPRKETKDYGTKRAIEGVYKEGDRVFIIEDVITSGSSLIEVIDKLRVHNLIVTDALVLIDREQGGVQKIKELGVRVHSLFTLSEITNALCAKGCIKNEHAGRITQFIREHQF